MKSQQSLPRLAPPYQHTYLLIKSLDPALQILQLLCIKITTVIQRAIQIFRQHLLVKALTRQSARRIPPCEVLIWPARSVEVASCGYIVDFAFHGEVDQAVGVQGGLFAVES
jgi:hypothetical protein